MTKNFDYAAEYKAARKAADNNRKAAMLNEVKNLRNKRKGIQFNLNNGDKLYITSCYMYLVDKNGVKKEEMNSEWQSYAVNFKELINLNYFKEAPGVWKWETKEGKGYTGGHVSQANYPTYNAPERSDAINIDLTTEGQYCGYYPEMGYIIPV